MFGVASSTAYIRAGGSGSDTRYILASLAKGFGGNTGDGAYVHDLFAAKTGIFNQDGFAHNSLYRTTLENHVPLLQGPYKIGAGAIIYAYANFTNIPEDSVVNCINTFSDALKYYMEDFPPTFTRENLEYVMSSFSLTDINSEVSGARRTNTKKAINYNWYDASPLFINTNFSSMSTLIRDTECQYYYLTGELLYSDLPTGLLPCIYYSTKIQTATGEATIRVLQQTPCVDGDSYVGPISGVKFFRKFVDGPGSSGLFNEETQRAYIEFDKAAMDDNDGSTNYSVVFANKLADDGSYVLLKSGVQTDVPGVFQSGREYGVGHSNIIIEGCPNHPAWPLMRMHQGDNSGKWYCESHLVGDYPDQTCEYSSGFYPWTGWKLATFELDKFYAKNYAHIKMNPKMDTGRAVKRVLNLDNYTDENGYPVTPYFDVSDAGNGTLTCGYTHVVGPPQFNGSASLPGFAFYQTFDNSNFPSGGEKCRFVMRPMITDGLGGFTLSDSDAASGIDNVNHSATSLVKAHVDIYKQIPSSGMVNRDDTFRKCFAMGDNFGNQASGTKSLQSNAGYLYTGYSYFKNGVALSVGELFQSNVKKVGDAYSKINFVNGYKSGSHTYFVNTKYGFIETGDISSGIYSPGKGIAYYYFDDGVLGAINSGWQDFFAPVPDEVQSNFYDIDPIYEQQDVENYLPRYIEGPYLTYDSRFLYPNAQNVANFYGANINGFPTGIKYVIEIKEETVREGFITSGLGGLVKNRYIMRAAPDGNQVMLETLMATPFTPNDSLYAYKYDYLRNKTLYPTEGGFFNSAGIDSNLVHQNYVPSTTACPQRHLNTTTYGYNNYFFDAGIRITGAYLNRYIYTGKSGAMGQVALPEPVGGGLYWGYRGKVLTGEMLYTPPVFSLESYSINPSDSLITAMVSEIYGSSGPTYSNNGTLVGDGLYVSTDSGYFYNGKDPIFFEYVGGRSGEGAEAEGGYHSKGIVGDAWYNVNCEYFGQAEAWCTNRYNYRYPRADRYLSLMNLTSTGLNIFARGFSYYPYYLNWSYQPFKSSSIGTIGVTLTPREVNKADYYFDFDLKNSFYPLKMCETGDGFSGLYSTGGLTIGPFDRDVELCITGRPLIPSGAFIIDGKIITHPDWKLYSCADPVTEFVQNTGIVLGEGGRNGLITTFKLVPSGKTTNLNFSGDSIVGVTGKTIVTIRPRNCVGAANLGSVGYNLSGDRAMMDTMAFINNGAEVRFDFPNSAGFENLIGKTISLTTKPREEILFPKPNKYDFDDILKPTYDTLGNKQYKQDHPTLEYWRILAPNDMYSGIREVTRVHIKIKSIEINRGPLPYQSFKTVVPSGECIISGKFGYTGQAESAIITDGIVLSGISGASSLSQLFEPIYVSDVMQRVPTGIFVIPSGDDIHPVLPAPSYMKRRKNPYVITGNDAYVSASPSISLNYNSFLWPAWSDLALLNPEVVYEQLPPDDGNVFPSSYLTFSAAKGQDLGTGKNPEENVTYAVVAQYAFIDSTATDPIYNTGKCIFSGETLKQTLNSGDLSGILTTEGNSLTMALNLNNFKT